MRLQVGVKALIKNSVGEYLFVRRSGLLSTDSSVPSWDIPGGRIDPGEKLADALRREVKEETGYNIESAPKLVAAQDILVPTKELHVVRLTYVVEEDITGIILSDEHDEYCWLGLGEFGTINIEHYLAELLSNM